MFFQAGHPGGARLQTDLHAAQLIFGFRLHRAALQGDDRRAGEGVRDGVGLFLALRRHVHPGDHRVIFLADAEDQAGELGVDQLRFGLQMLGDQRGKLRVETDNIVIAVIGLKRRVGDLHPHLKDALGQQFRRLGDRGKTGADGEGKRDMARDFFRVLVIMDPHGWLGVFLLSLFFQMAKRIGAARALR